MGKSTADFTWGDLLAAEPDDARRASDALYAQILGKKTAAGDAEILLRSVQAGNRSATAVLLLGFVRNTGDALRSLVRRHGGELVKLHDWSRPVPLSIAAAAALSRLGDKQGRRELLEGAGSYSASERVFLLDILPYVDAPEVLHAISEYLRDSTEIAEDVPSGAARRRMCDHAADAFLDRFQFPVTFARNRHGRYTAEQIEETMRHFLATVPR
ncbi:MAG: hypothetical protein IANPNBLG_03213 [Bryobacteraceae bacterium]|nr:hypothetical protein [Bryobacteraceae bacterium]